jgi:hypothetical protein
MIPRQKPTNRMMIIVSRLMALSSFVLFLTGLFASGGPIAAFCDAVSRHKYRIA